MSLDEQRAAALRDRWLVDPALFCVEVLGFTPWPRQTRILRDVPRSKRVTVRSGHKVGKSRTAVALALWFFTMFAESRVIMTAPTYRQVDQVLWRELLALHRNARYPIGGEPMKTPTGGLEYDGRQIIGLSTDENERFSGISAPHILYLVDEASGVAEEIFEAVDGNRAGGAWVVLFSNPTQLVGTFYESHTTKADAWSCHHISSREAAWYTENVRPVPGLATQEWVDERDAEWDDGSPQKAVRVDGDFPSLGSHQVVPLGSVKGARARWAELPVTPARPGLEVLEVGVDPARYGDDVSAFVARRGAHVYPPGSVQGMDTTEVAEAAYHYTRSLMHPGEADGVPDTHKPRVKVDVIGLGSGVADYMRKRFRGTVDVIDVCSSERSSDPTKYVTLRDELWWGIRTFIGEAGGTLPDHTPLRTELVAPSYKLDPAGRYKVQSKDEIKKTLKRSPDFADALALAVHRPARYRARVGTVKGI